MNVKELCASCDGLIELISDTNAAPGLWTLRNVTGGFYVKICS